MKKIIRRVVALVALGIAVGDADRACAQPATPPPPAKYKVVLRYRIAAPRDHHVAQYDALIAYLKKLDFEFIPPLDEHPQTDREDPSKNLLVGLLPSRYLRAALGGPNVASLLVMPSDYQLPEDAQQPVRVRLELAAGLSADRQRLLADQVRVLLAELGFREAVGYDHAGYSGRPHSRLAGTLPAGQVSGLIKDLRRQPAGWLAPELVQNELPAPLRNVVPIMITEVLPQPPGAPEPALAKPKGDSLDRISDELWSLLAEAEKDKERQRAIVRLELILAQTPVGASRGWREALVQFAPSLFIESQLGSVVTATVRLGQARDLAALPFVSVVRLAQGPRVEVVGAPRPKGDAAAVLGQSGLAELHRRGKRGQGVRLAIIDTDFRGWETLVQEGRLPARTRLIDLTIEQNPELVADAPGDGKAVGHGTQCALAAALAAPECELLLVRIDGLPFQLQQVLRHVRGDFTSEHIERRRDEVLARRADLARSRDDLLRDRRAFLSDFTDEVDLYNDFGFLGPVYGWIFSNRAWHMQHMAYQEKQEQALVAKEKRLQNYLQDLQLLEGTPIVASPLVWNDRYPVDGAGPLSRWLDDQPLKTLWFQSAGNARGQTWHGSFVDEDGNGVMEFAAAGKLPPGKLPPGRWTRELNFLGWQPWDGAPAAELPAGARLRVTMQWREPHDPDFAFRTGEPDLFLTPLLMQVDAKAQGKTHPLRMVLLRQRDPDGKTTGAADFDVVARSSGLPQRLDSQPSAAVYEMTLDFTIDKPGRYALRIERPTEAVWLLRQEDGHLTLVRQGELIPVGTRPLGAAVLPELERRWEFRPRLLVQTVDEVSGAKGRPVFLDFVTDAGAMGTLADAHAVIAVGAADLAGRPRPTTPVGSPAGQDLTRKPDVLAYDALPLPAGGAYGSSVANAFAAGLAAATLSAGMTPEQFRMWLRQQSGRVLQVP